MCSRYYMPGLDAFQTDEYLQMMYELQSQTIIFEGNTKLSGEMYPTDSVPVIANNRRLEPRPYVMKWGYTYKHDKKKIINARSETAHEKYMFKEGMAKRRCLIPASQYFEWETRGTKKIKYAIKLADQDIMFMAGIYRIEQGVPVFSILTREVSDNISFIHNRMPVILSNEFQKNWLDIKLDANQIIKSSLTDVEYEQVG